LNDFPNDQGGNAVALLVGLSALGFRLPSTIYDLPFLSKQAKRNILGGNAIRLFNLRLPAQKLARAA
jgi:hypothetical protein